jgi:hypothetical protein
MVTKELESLQSSITRLLQALENKNRVTQHSHRQDPSLDATPDDALSTFDLFLLHLSRLQTSVVECIRAVTAAMPPTADTSLMNDTANAITKRADAGKLSHQGDMLSFIFAQNGDVGQIATQPVEQEYGDEDVEMGLKRECECS